LALPTIWFHQIFVSETFVYFSIQIRSIFPLFFSRLDSEDLGLTSLVRNHLGSSTGQIGCCVVDQTTFLARGLLKNFAVDARVKSV
jgi:hypothetical protein